MIDLKEEMREDMMREAREEEFTCKQMREDFDFFMEISNGNEIIKSINSLINVACQFGYERDDVIEYIKDNI